MKKKLIYAAFLILFVLAAPACSKTCKTCQKITYDSSGSVVSQDNPAQYCGVELTGIEATPPVTIGGQTAKWVCN
jgi:hypothetical protein